MVSCGRPIGERMGEERLKGEQKDHRYGKDKQSGLRLFTAMTQSAPRHPD
jgi:hypothetical protein